MSTEGVQAASDSGDPPPGGTGESSEHSVAVHVLSVAGLFLASRLVFFVGGVRFRAFPPSQWQLLDVDQLRADPFLAFTHNMIQPPLWNFFVGAILRWSPFPVGITFQLLFLGAGLTTVIALWFLLRDLGSPRWIATVSATIVGWSPLMVRDESLLNIEIFETMILTVAVLAFHRYVRLPSLGRFIWFMAVAAIAVLSRTTIQPLWMIGGVIAALAASRPRASRVATTGAVCAALVLIAAPAFRNYTTFGTLGYSGYSGMNLERIAVMQLPEKDLDRLIRNGKLSEASRVLPFSNYSAYAPYFGVCHPRSGIAVLDDFSKGNGEANPNNICYLPVYRKATRDAIAAIRAEPGNYVRSTAKASLLFSSWRLSYEQPDSGAYRAWVRLYAPLTAPVHIHYSLGAGDPQPAAKALAPLLGVDRFSVTVGVGLLLSVFWGLRSLWSIIRRRGVDADWARVFIAYTVVSVAAVSILAEFFENGRYREPLDPIVLGPLYAWLLAGGSHMVAALRMRMGRERPTEPRHGGER
ncbi:MAG: glycosyltransferase family 39 protein [Actinobacteria bacterium]|nr:glycosyltransferase family 39 protein [Actinomycetota bacterium]